MAIIIPYHRIKSPVQIENGNKLYFYGNRVSSPVSNGKVNNQNMIDAVANLYYMVLI